MCVCVIARTARKPRWNYIVDRMFYFLLMESVMEIWGEFFLGGQ